MLNMKDVEKVHLSLNHRFKFRCHKGIDCFTKCCNNIKILLTPYDIIRLKKRLGISSGEFLTDYTYVEVEDKTSHPFVFLKMKNDEDKKCPFVTTEGCTIYEDRPANCRYYPVGQASLKKLDTTIDEVITQEFYFFVKEDHCHGFREDTDWTIASWRDDQGVDIYDDMNRGWKEILFETEPAGARAGREETEGLLHGQLRRRQVQAVRFRERLPGQVRHRRRPAEKDEGG
ncbi:MAG: YkgJ family cysteine cluster protein [Desulfobacterales bacterium]|nr:YkgJ family cysteine cluster protein [Desulfobacterales bacterium]